MPAIFVLEVIGSVAASMHSTAAPLVLTQRVGLDAKALGLSMSASSVAVAALGAFETVEEIVVRDLWMARHRRVVRRRET